MSSLILAAAFPENIQSSSGTFQLSPNSASITSSVETIGTTRPPVKTVQKRSAEEKLLWLEIEVLYKFLAGAFSLKEKSPTIKVGSFFTTL